MARCTLRTAGLIALLCGCPGRNPHAARDGSVDAATELRPGAAACQNADLRCEGNAPAGCDAPGNSGAFSSVGEAPRAGALRLVQHKLETSSRLCKGNLCVTGGIRP